MWSFGQIGLREIRLPYHHQPKTGDCVQFYGVGDWLRQKVLVLLSQREIPIKTSHCLHRYTQDCSSERLENCRTDTDNRSHNLHRVILSCVTPLRIGNWLIFNIFAYPDYAGPNDRNFAMTDARSMVSIRRDSVISSDTVRVPLLVNASKSQFVENLRISDICWLGGNILGWWLPLYCGRISPPHTLLIENVFYCRKKRITREGSNASYLVHLKIPTLALVNFNLPTRLVRNT